MVLDESLILSALASFSCKTLIQTAASPFTVGTRGPWINQSLERLARPSLGQTTALPLYTQPSPGLTTATTGNLKIQAKGHCAKHTLQ